MSPQQLVSVIQRTAGSTSTRGSPLAVGRLVVNLDTLKADAKGKAVHLLHTWKDHLFNMGNKADPPGEMEAGEDEGRDEDTPESEAAGAGTGQESVPDNVATVPNRMNGAVSNALPPGESLAPTSVPERCNKMVFERCAVTDYFELQTVDRAPQPPIDTAHFE